MVFNLFRKSKTDDLIKPPIRVESSNEKMVFETGEGSMIIDDVFSIKGRGTVVTGRVESGSIAIGNKVTIQTAAGPISSTVTGIEAFHKKLDFATAGTNAGIVLSDVSRESVNRGDVISVNKE
jgi:translation elongation factor EF-Tu-like GTPase